MAIEINTQQQKKVKTQMEPQNLNLCVVLDRSGSMSGTKLYVAKECCKSIVQRLSSEDRFTLVTFDDECETVISPITSRDQIEQNIDNISTGGTTNLANGWRQGTLELQTYSNSSLVNRLILLSDGQANRGETKASVLGEESARHRDEHNITTSAIGIGTSFNDEILALISYESGGRFYAVRDTQIEDIINLEFKGSLATQIERPGIKLQLPAGVEIVEEFHNLKRSDDKYRIRPILDNDVFNFALRLRITPASIPEKAIKIVCTLYDGNGIMLENEHSIRLGSDEEYVTMESNPLVLSIVEQYKISESENETIKHIESGNLTNLSGFFEIHTDGLDYASQVTRRATSQIDDKTSQSLFFLEATLREAELMERKSKRRKVFLPLIRIVRHLRNIAQESYNRDVADFTQRIVIALRQDQQMTSGRNEYNIDGKLLNEYLIDTADDALRLVDLLIQGNPEDTELVALRNELTNALKKLD
ncbi:MAG: VWA domain-containing protein [Anaerolineae bacterium]|nr:VWA domain-containing protein [Anaerolineae bacterium]